MTRLTHYQCLTPFECVFADCPLGQQATSSYKASVSDQTAINRRRQAEYYLTFAIYYSVDILSPSIQDSALYQQFLANSLTSPASRRNYTSGARMWIEARGGDYSALTAFEAVSVAKGAINLKPHITVPAPALTPQDLVRVCQYLKGTIQGLPIVAALCVGFFAFLRASNLLTPTATLWQGPHTLTRGDITSNDTGLIVVIRSSKTIKKGTKPAILSLPRIPNSPACPALAWDTYTSLVPSPPTSPAFILYDGRPVTPSHLTTVVRHVLIVLGVPYGPSFSGHSLRRGGSQAAVVSGSDPKDIAKHGTWTKVSGLKPYVSSLPSQRVSDKLSTLFATL